MNKKEIRFLLIIFISLVIILLPFIYAIEIKKPTHYTLLNNNGNVFNPQYAFDQVYANESATYASLTNSNKNLPNGWIEYNGWQGSYTQSQLKVLISTTGFNKNRWRIRYSINNGSSWNIFVDATNASVQLRNYEVSINTTNISQVKIRFDILKSGKGDSSNDFRIYDIWIEGVPPADTTPPSVTINQPTPPGVNLSTSNVNFNVSLNEDGDTCLYSLNDGATNISMTRASDLRTFSANSSIADGYYIVRFFCNDTAGNLNGTETRAFTIDTIIPSVTSLTEAPSDPATYSSGARYEFNATITDINLQNVFIEFDSINYTTSNLGDIFNFTIKNLAAGTYTYRWYADDSAGNINNTETGAYTINKAASEVNLTLNGTEGDITITQGSTIDLNGTTVIGDSGVILRLYNNGILINEGNSPIGNTTTFNNEGLFNITLIYQTSQNYSQSSKTYWVNVTFVPDNNPPIVTIVSPLNQTYTTSSIDFNISLNENGDTAWFTLNNGATNYTMTKLNNTYFNYTNSSIADGSYTAKFYVNDTSGNLNDTAQVTFSINTTAIPPSNWANTNLDRCRNITITSGVSSTLTNFPAYVNLTKDDEMLANYNDLRFYDTYCNNNGSLLAYEIENYTSTKADIWIGIPSLPSTGTIISVYYKNNTAISSGQNATRVWDSNYKMVQHLEETPANGVLNGHVDSTSNSVNATAIGFDGTPTSTTDATGIIDGSDYFDATNSFVNTSTIPGIPASGGNYTVEAWLNADAFPATSPSFFGGNINKYKPNMRVDSTGLVGVVTDVSQSYFTSNTALSTGAWYYVAISIDNVNIRIYINGVLDRSGTLGFTATWDSTGHVIGARNASNNGDNKVWDGLIDEVRVSNITRSAVWINQTYTLVTKQTNYVSLGAEENRILVDNPPSVTLNSPSNGTTLMYTDVTFNCSATDSGANPGLVNISLWITNSSNTGFSLNQTKNLTGTSDSATFQLNLTDNSTYTWNCQAYDNALQGAFASNNFTLYVNTLDITPPVRSNGAPSGTLPAGTTSTTLSLNTDENATCKYATTPEIAYENMTNTFSTTGGTSHSTNVSGLSNGSSYNYYVKCQDESGNANTDDFLISFSVASSVESFIFAAGGDHGWNANTNASLDKLNQSNASFYLALGDMSYSTPGTETSWCNTVKSRLNQTYPFELVSGNHEEEGGPNGYILNFAACLPDRLGVNGTYAAEYYFDYANLTRIIMTAPSLTINGTTYNYNVGSSNYNWLSNVIDDARNKSIPWVVVGMHKNCITAGTKSCEIGADMMNLLLNKKVDLILQGHDHVYERSKQLSCAQVNFYNSSCVVDDGSDNIYTKGLGSVFVIAGMFGYSLYDINTADSEAGYFAKWMGNNINPTYGLVKFSVNATQLSGQFVGSSGGTFNDSFSVVTSG